MLFTVENIPAATYASVVSVVPSLTELLYDLGLSEEVKGITKFCVRPQKWLQEKTKVGGTKNLDVEKIKSLRPGLIIANKEENQKEQIETLALACDVLLTDIDSLATAILAIKNIGIITGRSEKANEIAYEIEKKFFMLQQKISGKPKLNAAYFIWKKPFMVAGGNTFINDMMMQCGLQNVFVHRERYPHINPDEFLSEQINCELVILSSEPFPFREKHIGEFQKICPGAKVTLADGEMFSWYGSRLLEAAGYFENFRNGIL